MRDVRSWWLDIAKSLFVGERVRVTHPQDTGSRPSVIVRNEETSYTAHCFRRNSHDYVPKERVIPRSAPVDSALQNIPQDKTPLRETPKYVQRSIESFLITRGVTSAMFPPQALHWSDTRKRILVQNSGIVLGRDVTEQSPSKWVDYTPKVTNYTQAMHVFGNMRTVVLVEDSLSAYKIRHCTGNTAVALLGTKLHDIHRNMVMRYPDVVVFMDGDFSGTMGGIQVVRDLRALGGVNYRVCTPPPGKDPKDLTYRELRELVNGPTIDKGVSGQTDI